MTRTIAEILADKGMSQGELARRAGLSRLTVYAAYRGKSVSLDTLVKIARALEVPLAEIAPEAAKALEEVA